MSLPHNLPKILYLVPDTNLFIQCKALNELPWDLWPGFEEIRVVVTRPIQKEIDGHKNKGHDRLSKRGRVAAALLKEVIASAEESKIINSERPLVRLFVRVDIKPSPELDNSLDYTETDDRLVGCAHALKSQFPECEVRVFTHDSGPLASSKAVGVLASSIPDTWLLPPEANVVEQKLNVAQAELARLKRAEPDFSILAVNENSDAIEKFETSFVRYEPLSVSEAANLIDRIADKYPVASDFSTSATSPAQPNFVGLFKVNQTFHPPSPQEIAAYTALHSKWLDACKFILKNYHNRLDRSQRRARFCFSAANRGLRPARDALVTLEARGNFAILPPSPKTMRGDQSPESYLDLPRPPMPPKGRWKSDFDGLLAHEDYLRKLGIGLDPYAINRELVGPFLPKPGSFRRDANTFYYKDRPDLPLNQFSLECEQWRHGEDPETFFGDIYYEAGLDQINGAVVCRIQAENLSEILEATLPVRISIKKESCLLHATQVVDQLVASGAGVDISEIGGLPTA